MCSPANRAAVCARRRPLQPAARRHRRNLRHGRGRRCHDGSVRSAGAPGGAVRSQDRSGGQGGTSEFNRIRKWADNRKPGVGATPAPPYRPLTRRTAHLPPIRSSLLDRRVFRIRPLRPFGCARPAVGAPLERGDGGAAIRADSGRYQRTGISYPHTPSQCYPA
jgi:hypothetical protein